MFSLECTRLYCFILLSLYRNIIEQPDNLHFIMKQYLLALMLILMGSYSSAQSFIIPTPQVESMKRGHFTLSKGSQFSFQGDASQKDYFNLLKQDLQSLSADELSSNELVFVLDPLLNMDKEAYLLEIKADQIILQAQARNGLRYGVEALKQLARIGNGKIRCARIQSSPRFSWRGFMLDESRHFFGKEKVKQYLDIMANLHLNVFHWHLTDEPGWRIEIKKYPKLTTVGGIGNWHEADAEASFYTQEDIKEIVAYAQERNIMIVPEIDMPGHASAASRAYPELSGGGEGRWEGFTFHPTKESTYQFIDDVLSEIVELFPFPYIHIGGDEVHYGNQSWFTDPEIQQFIKDKKLANEKELEHYFVRRVADIIASKGRKMIGWDEVLDAGVSPSKVIVMWWRHDRKYQLLKALESGYEVVLTPRRPMYADFFQHSTHRIGRYWDGYNPIEDILNFPKDLEHYYTDYPTQIKGMQMSLWTERVADNKRLDYMTFPRLIGVAESAWTVESKKSYSLFMMSLPHYLRYLDSLSIYYFNPLDPALRKEPWGPSKQDVIQNG